MDSEKKEGVQLNLLTAEQLAAVTEESCKAVEFKQGIYSGVQFKQQEPAKYELLLTLICSGRFSWREMRQAVGVSFGLISGIIKEQAADIEAVKKNQAAESRAIVAMTNEASKQWLLNLMDNPAKLNKMTPTDFKSLRTAAAIDTDKALVQTGQATQIIGDLKPEGLTHADFESFLGSLPSAEVEEMDFAGEKVGSKRDGFPAPLSGDPLAVDAVDSVDDEGGSSSSLAS